MYKDSFDRNKNVENIKDEVTNIFIEDYPEEGELVEYDEKNYSKEKDLVKYLRTHLDRVVELSKEEFNLLKELSEESVRTIVKVLNISALQVNSFDHRFKSLEDTVRDIFSPDTINKIKEVDSLHDRLDRYYDNNDTDTEAFKEVSELAYNGSVEVIDLLRGLIFNPEMY